LPTGGVGARHASAGRGESVFTARAS